MPKARTIPNTTLTRNQLIEQAFYRREDRKGCHDDDLEHAHAIGAVGPAVYYAILELREENERIAAAVTAIGHAVGIGVDLGDLTARGVARAEAEIGR